MNKIALACGVAMSLLGCASPPSLNSADSASKVRALAGPVDNKANVSAKWDMEQLRQALQGAAPLPIKPRVEEKRFSIAVKNLPASSALQIIAESSNLNVVVTQDVRDLVTLNLKDVTMLEALEALRDVYGIEYEVTGRRILASKQKIQNKIYQMDYLSGSRVGKSEVTVSSGSLVENPSATPTGGASGSSTGASSASTQNKDGQEGSKITTTTKNDFWQALDLVLRGIIAGKDGQEVVLNPQSGLVYVKAWPSQQRDVEKYLAQMQNRVARQVVLEAKIIEVTLSNGSQQGINWATFDPSGNHKYSVGANPATIFPQGGGFVAPTPLGGGAGLFNPANLAGSAGLLNVPNSLAGSVATGLGLAFTGTSFAALLNFLQSQGDVEVLSAPRVATLNNQQAVLKVGRDEFFVTNVSTTSMSSGSSTTTTPSVSVQPFFSGIALDVTPQIDDNGYVILHVHPTVSDVGEKTKVLSLGGMGTVTLPLASSNINESDTIVRLLDGDIVAIGGLMSSSLYKGGQKVPILGDVPLAGALFSQRSDGYKKMELVILIKATVINKPSDWASTVPVSMGR